MPSNVFNVRDFGAKGDGITDDTAAIQAALDAAAKKGGTVYLPAGTYIVSGTGNPTDGALRFGSNTEIHGDGPSLTEIKLADGSAFSVTGILRTPINTAVSNIFIHDLSINGNRANTPLAHDVIGFFTGDVDEGQYSADITVQRVEIHHVSGYGFDPHERTYRIHLLDNIAHHNGRDGFALDYLVDSEVSRNIAYANDRHGFNIVTQTHDLLFAGNEAYANGSTGLTIQRGSYDVPGPYNVVVQGGSFHDNAKQGVLIKMSDDITVTDAEVHGNGTTGIELYGVDGSTITGNVIHDNSGSAPGIYDGVLIRTYVDTIFDKIFTSDGNTVSSNQILGAHRNGIRKAADGSGGNTIAGNTITGNTKEDIVVSSPTTTVSHQEAQTPGLTYDVLDHGATPNDQTDDTDAINDAIVAAHEAGGGTVVLPAGTFIVSGNPSDKSDGAIRLLSNVTLDGAGLGVTIIKVANDWDGNITGVVRTPFDEVTTNVALSDLTIDGNRVNTTGKIDGFYTGVRPNDTRQDADITVSRVEIMNMSGYGFDPHEQTIRLVIEDSVAHHNGLDGFVADFIIDGVYRNNLAYENDRHGFNITTSTRNLLLDNNVARDNGSTGITVQRGSEDIPWPSDILILGGEYYGNAREGVFLKLADSVHVSGALVHHNGRSGIAVDGSTNTIVEGSTIHDNSRSSHLSFDEVRVDEFVDATTGSTYGGLNTQIFNNTLFFTDPSLRSAFAIREMNDSSAGTIATGNSITGWTGGGISIPGLAPQPIIGTDGSELLQGGSGNESIAGMGGDDTLYGGAGADSMDGGAGFDITSYGGANSAVSVNLSTGAGAGGEATGDRYVSIEGVLGSLGADTILGGAGADLLMGHNGNDAIGGAAGHDTLDGGGGADTMTGGSGDDLYLVNMSTDRVIEGAGEGTDTVGASNSHTLAAEVEVLLLTGANATNGTGNALDNLIVGNDAANQLKGMGGRDTLDGGGSADTLTGGAGDDVFVLRKGSVAGDTINDFSGAGADGGDLIHFEGYDAGAVLTFGGGVWTITDGNSVESFTVKNVSALTGGSDYVFG